MEFETPHNAYRVTLLCLHPTHYEYIDNPFSCEMSFGRNKMTSSA